MIWFLMMFTLMLFGTPQLGAGIYLCLVSDARMFVYLSGVEIHIQKHDVGFYEDALRKFDSSLSRAFMVMGFK